MATPASSLSFPTGNPEDRIRSPFGRAPEIVSLAMLYFLFGNASFLTSVSNAVVTPVFFAPEGIALAAAILLGPGVWPGVFLGQLALALSRGLPWGPSLALSAINSAEAVAGCLLFRRFKLRPDMGSLRDLVGLQMLIFCVLQPFSATLGTGTLWLAGVIRSTGDLGGSWVNWWLGNCIAQSQIVPLLLALSGARATGKNLWNLLLPLVVLTPALFLAFLYFDGHGMALPLVLFSPLLLLLAVYRGLASASLGGIVLTVVSLYATNRSFGPFASGGKLQILDMDVLILVPVLTSQLIALLMEDRRASERELKRARDAADSASRAKSEFLANMSHEIRTPLNGVIGMNSLLLESGLSDKQRRYAEIASTSGRALLAVISDILDFSKIEAGKLELETLDFDLPGLLADFADTMVGRAHEKGLELICAADPGVPPLLRGDPNRLTQILTNLAGNAIKFTKSGSVAISVSMTSETGSEAALRFSVRDTGPGIPKDKLGGLFEKFTQIDASTTRIHGGTGLGLAISKQLVGLMGGHIGAESEPGKGSEFWFELRLPKQPTRKPRRPQSVDGSAANRFAGRKARILVAEDDATNQLVVTGIFEMLGMSADLVANGAEAVEAIRTNPYDLVFMDVNMPGMDGYMATKAMRKLEAQNRMPGGPSAASSFGRIPIIAMTANALKGDREKCLDAGMDGYLPKPISVKSMSEFLARWLPADAAAKPVIASGEIPFQI